MDERLRQIYREVASGQASPLQLIAALYRGGHQDEADALLLEQWNALRVEGRGIYFNQIMALDFDERTKRMGQPEDPLFQEWYTWIQKVLTLVSSFPPRCACRMCLICCDCFWIGRNCNLNIASLDDPVTCSQCETIMPHLGSNCLQPRIDQGSFAIDLYLETQGKGWKGEHTFPCLICEDMHWYQGEAPGQGYNDVSYLRLHPECYVRTSQMPNEILRWILEHATHRVPPEEEYDWSSDEEQWRAALEEEQEGFGSGLGPR